MDNDKNNKRKHLERKGGSDWRALNHEGVVDECNAYTWIKNCEKSSETRSSNLIESYIGYDLSEQIVCKIHQEKWSLIVGCIAWLCNEKILAALASAKVPCMFVVQKEDWLRPDVAIPPGQFMSNPKDRKKLRRSYSQLIPVNFTLEEWMRLVGHGDIAQCERDVPDESQYQTFDLTGAVRCAGYKGSERMARVHHKFAVFFKGETYDPKQNRSFFHRSYMRPVAVWSGSYNWSNNGDKGRENGLFIKNEATAEHYAKEFLYVLMHSEDLDWKTPHSSPCVDLSEYPHSWY